MNDQTAGSAPTTTPPADRAETVTEVSTVAAAAATVAAAPAEDVAATVTELVSQITGYPAELLDPALDMEADLGVDTVKQAEVFAAVRERFAIPADENLQLRDFPTLNHVIAWVNDQRGGGATPATPAPAPTEGPSGAQATPPPTAPQEAAAAETQPAESAGEPTEPTVESVFTGETAAIDAFPRRVPVPALRAPISNCVPTGVSLAEDARVILMADEGGVGAELAKRFSKHGGQVLQLDAGASTNEITAATAEFAAAGKVDGVFWLPGLDDEGALAEMSLDDWHEALRRRATNLHAVMHPLAEAKPFLVVASRLGGQHGYGAEPATAPMGGTVTGFAKSYKRELPDVLVKAVDFALAAKPGAIADMLLEEAQYDPGAVEIGRVGGHRWGIGLTTEPFPAPEELLPGGMTLNKDSVFVITGASGAIVSAITADLAAASGGTFHLLARTSAPDPADPDLAKFETDKDGLKRDLAERIKAAGGRPTPVAIERELSKLERSAAMLAAIQAVQQAGGSAVAHAVDINDPAATQAVIDQIKAQHGRIDVLAHAAGVEISKVLSSKDAKEFDLVLGVKADGWFNLMKALGDTPVGATVAFSSVAGRFGNAGQTDYAAGIDLLCKLASTMRATHPNTKAYALDWTAWGGIGMATRGSIPKIMEAAGVQMLTPEAGIPWIRRELTSGLPAGEVVVAGEMGQMAAPFHPSGGLDVSKYQDLVAAAGPMVGAVVGSDVEQGLLVEVTLDPTAQPFLFDHRIDGVPVLPGVMGIESFSEAAKLLLPTWHVVGVEDVDFSNPLKFFRDEPRTLRITALTRPAGAQMLVECTLSAERQLPGSSEPVRTVHFRGKVRLAKHPRKQGKVITAPEFTGEQIAPVDVYRMYFHGPAYQVVGTAGRNGDKALARMADQLPANHQPAEQATVARPRLIELCFQTAGLWEAGRAGRLALPSHIDQAEVFPGDAESAELTCVSKQRDDGAFDAFVTDESGRVAVRLSGYRTIALPALLPDEIAAPLSRVMND